MHIWLHVARFKFEDSLIYSIQVLTLFVLYLILFKILALGILNSNRSEPSRQFGHAMQI